MISNRHIRKDYAEGMDFPYAGRRTAMCGKRVRHELAGIPSVTQQDLLVSSGGKVRPGWCLTCAYELILFVRAYMDNSQFYPTAVSTSVHHGACAAVAAECTTRYFEAVPAPDREEPENNTKFEEGLTIKAISSH